MDYFYSVLIGIGLSIFLWMTPIFTGIFGSFIWPLYVAIAIFLPFYEFGVPVFPYVIVSFVVSLYLFKINDDYSQSEAMSSAPEWAARCQVSYGFILNSFGKIFCDFKINIGV